MLFLMLLKYLGLGPVLKIILPGLAAGFIRVLRVPGMTVGKIPIM
jgi:hypothetical protein